eukprot:5009378-Prorocentrum_lima.AAC.1
MSAHSAEGILSVEGHHHCIGAAQVDPCLQYLVLCVGSPWARGKLSISPRRGHSLPESSGGCGKEDPTPSTENAD